jgi:hypothetical protein
VTGVQTCALPISPFLLFDGIEMTAFFCSFIVRGWQYPALWKVDVSLSCE